MHEQASSVPTEVAVAPPEQAGAPEKPKRPRRREEIPAEEYDRDFYLSDHLEGFAEYRSGELSYVKQKQLEMLELAEGVTFLEVGYGRGELLLHAAMKKARVWGVDYSPDAVLVARETLRRFPDADLRTADSRRLPFPDDRFDRVFSGDVIEHMSYSDAVRSLAEMYRVVRPGGFVLVKTTPNTVFVRWVYPLAKHFFRRLDPASVRLMDEQLELMRRIHVDEYDYFKLRRAARLAGMPHAKVWIDPDIVRSNRHRYSDRFRESRLIQWAAALGRFAPVRFFLGNDLYLLCRKP